jgi:lysophospholipase L1-like esterase
MVWLVSKPLLKGKYRQQVSTTVTSGDNQSKRSRVKDMKHKLVAVLLLAGLALSANAQNYPDPTRFEADILAFEQADQAAMPPQNAILLTGSSSIARWNDQAVQALAPLTVIPRGFGGSVMRDLVHYLDRVALVYKPRAILIYEGDNDTGFANWGITNEMILKDLQSIITRIHQTLPATRIYVMSVKPSILREAIWPRAVTLNEAYALLAAADPLVYYVDAANPFLDADGKVMQDIFIGDNLHFNDLGNAIWGAVIKAALMPQEGRFEPALTAGNP